ncbi:MULTISPECIES: RNA polymerase sigma factor [unclassified Nocardioides]|uniref:RNA polymerase sigma factor n=1 Tax=unclassified Nocardioides TaxID=2615069 RepID=UPI00191073C2|nr:MULTISPECIES: sigma-70 family RNA polymerase sigma factor [unclassified Nocardioides]
MEAFYREHAETVKTFLARRIADPHQVADLTADIFLAAIGSADRYRPDEGAPLPWLLGIARNAVADATRRRARRLRAESRIQGRRLLDEDATARIAERIDAERLTRALYDALAALPARDRRLMELVAVDGLSVTDAAAELGVKPGTARVRLHRSRARVQLHMDNNPSRNTNTIERPLASLVQEVTP